MRMHRARLATRQKAAQLEAAAAVRQLDPLAADDILIWQDGYDDLGGIPATYSTVVPNPWSLWGGAGNPDVGVATGGSGGGDSSFSSGSGGISILATLCPDGETYGYDDWSTLRDAVAEANGIAAEDFLRWNEYVVLSSQREATNLVAAASARKEKKENDGKDGGDAGNKPQQPQQPPLQPPTFEAPEPFVVCPGVTLTQTSSRRYKRWFQRASSSKPTPPARRSRPRRSKNKMAPIFINAEDIVIECDSCIVDVPGTHLSFGPHAKNVLVRGVTFRGATSSSLTFHHHGAEATFEDCFWLSNSGGSVSSRNSGAGGGGDIVGGIGGSGQVTSTTTSGAVADLNSTSTVAFYRCVIDDQRQNPRRANVGAGVANVPGMNPPGGHLNNGVNPPNNAGMSSSLTIRN